MDDTRSTVLIEVRRHGNPNCPVCEFGRIPVAGEYALFGDHLICVTHVIHVEGQPSVKRPGTHTKTGDEYRHNGRIVAVIYVEETSDIPGIDFSDVSELEPR